MIFPSRLRSRGWIAFALTVTLLARIAAAGAASKSFDLPADDAEKSLKRFAAQSGLEVLFSATATAGVRTPPVRGEFLPLEAIQRLLDGTKLTATRNPETGALVISRLVEGDTGGILVKKKSHASASRP